MSRHPRFSSLPNLCSNCRTCIQQSSSNRFATLQSDCDQSNQLFNFAEEEAVVMAHELEHLNLDPYVSNNVLATLKKHLVQGMQNYQSRLRSSCPESTVFNQSRPVSCRARSSSSSSFPPPNPCPSPSPSNNFHHSKTPFQSGMSSQPCSPDSCLPFHIIPPVCSPSPNPSHTPSPNINSKRPNEPSPDCLSRSHTPECRLNPNRYDLAPQVPLGYPAIKCMDQSQSPQLNNRHDNEVHPLCQESGVCRAALSPNLPQSQDPESLNLDCSQITKVYLLKECSPVEESPCCQLILQSSPQQLDDQGYPPCSRTRQSELSRVNRRFCGENHGHPSPRRQMEPQVPDHESQPQQQVSVACSPHPCLSAVLVCSPRKDNGCPCKKQNCPLSKEKQDLLASNPIVRCGFLRLVATFHGKLTRDLFITEKVIDMIRMIKDTAEVLLSFCSDKKSTLEKEEEQFACRLQSQLQSSLSRLHHLFIETTSEERLAALRGSHNWRAANNFGQPRQRSPPVPALACGTSLPTPRTPLYNPSPPAAAAKASGAREAAVRRLVRRAPLLRRLVSMQPSLRSRQSPTESPRSPRNDLSSKLAAHSLLHVPASNSTSTLLVVGAKAGALKPKSTPGGAKILTREKSTSHDGERAVAVGTKSLPGRETQTLIKGESVSLGPRTTATAPTEAKAVPNGSNPPVGAIQIFRGKETTSFRPMSAFSPVALDAGIRGSAEVSRLVGGGGRESAAPRGDGGFTETAGAAMAGRKRKVARLLGPQQRRDCPLQWIPRRELDTQPGPCTGGPGVSCCDNSRLPIGKPAPLAQSSQPPYLHAGLWTESGQAKRCTSRTRRMSGDHPEIQSFCGGGPERSRNVDNDVNIRYSGKEENTSELLWEAEERILQHQQHDLPECSTPQRRGRGGGCGGWGEPATADVSNGQSTEAGETALAWPSNAFQTHQVPEVHPLFAPTVPRGETQFSDSLTNIDVYGIRGRLDRRRGGGGDFELGPSNEAALRRTWRVERDSNLAAEVCHQVRLLPTPTSTRKKD
uniref:Rac guanyl nucleotide exchange factor n=1 Tax=Echinococcus granulosus TaxID=6210 RepID=A0A068WJE0_ECHGR|nr:rac guanyl nucleotide exchange factor [Echinococcus granulosus]